MDAKRIAIIDAAKKSFELHGYKGTTMGHIAKIAGVGKGTIYLYFQSKEELLNEIIHLLIDEMKRIAEDAVRPEAPIFDKIHRALYGILMFRKEHELLIKLAREAAEFGNPVTREALDSIETEVIAFVSELIGRAVNNGTIKPCDPEITAFLLFKLYLALVYDWERQHQPLPDEKVLELLKLYLMKGLSL